MPGQRFVFGSAQLRPGQANQLDLVELVNPEQPPGVLSGGAGLAAETGGIAHQGDRERVGLEDLIPVQIGEGHLRGRDEKQVIADRVEIFLELGQLAGPGHGGAVHHVGRGHFPIAMLAGMQVQHESSERTDQPRP